MGITLYHADCRGDENNTFYPHEVSTNSATQIIYALSHDHMTSKMKNGTRDKDNFLECSTLMIDIDNTHSEDENEWKTLGDIQEMLPVNILTVQSRNYMKMKSKFNKKTKETITYAPREKWHIYLPLRKKITSREEYEALMIDMLALCPFIDSGAIDSARFFYGVAQPHIDYDVSNEQCIDEYIQSLSDEEKKEMQLAQLEDMQNKALDGTYTLENVKGTVSKLCEYLGQPNRLPGSSRQKSKEYEKNTSEEETEEEQTAPDWLKFHHRDQRVIWLKKWADEHNVILGKQYSYYDKDKGHCLAFCVECPWEEDHSEDTGEAQSVITITQNGTLGYICRHNCHSSMSWRDFREFYEPGYLEKKKERADQENGQQTASDSQSPYVPEEKERPKLKIEGLADYGAQYKENREKFEHSIRSGYTCIDRALSGGFVPDLYIMAAKTGQGKSAIAFSIACNMAKQDVNVLYFALEMSKDEFIARGSSAMSYKIKGEKSAVPFSEMLNDREDRDSNGNIIFSRRPYSDYEHETNVFLREYGDKLKIIECGIASTTADDICQIVSKYRQAHPGELFAVFIDYLQILASTSNDAFLSASESIQKFRALAVQEINGKEERYNTVVYVISSVPKGTKEIGEDSFKNSSDIAFTGGILLGWDWYEENHTSSSGYALVDVSDREKEESALDQCNEMGYRIMKFSTMKNRNGIKGKRDFLKYRPAFNVFEEMTEEVRSKAERVAEENKQNITNNEINDEMMKAALYEEYCAAKEDSRLSFDGCYSVENILDRFLDKKGMTRDKGAAKQPPRVKALSNQLQSYLNDRGTVTKGRFKPGINLEGFFELSLDESEWQDMED